jgi:hypothetical protein
MVLKKSSSGSGGKLGFRPPPLGNPPATSKGLLIKQLIPKGKEIAGGKGEGKLKSAGNLNPNLNLGIDGRLNPHNDASGGPGENPASSSVMFCCEIGGAFGIGALIFGGYQVDIHCRFFYEIKSPATPK